MVTPGDVYDSVSYLEHLEQLHKNVIPLQTVAADSVCDFLLAHRVLKEHSIDFFVRPQSNHDHTQVSSSGRPFLITRQKTFISASTEKAVGQAVVPQCQRAVLGVLGEPKGLYQLSYAGEVLERNGPARRPEADRQLFQVCRPTASDQTVGARISRGAEAAAGLE